jgi:hypothetical protein
MGIHHFKLSMVPRAYFERIGSPVPSALSDEEVDRGENADTGWWSSFQPTEQALARLRHLCPINKSWGKTEEFVTSETWGSDLRIWNGQSRVWSVTFRFSPSTDDHTLLDQFVAIARGEHCLLLDDDTGFLFEPDDKVVAERLRNSRAMRFVRDPQSTTIKAAKETPQ